MTYNKILLSALAIAAAASSSFAQAESAPVATSAGLIGQRYVAVSGLAEDFRDAGGLDNAFGGTIGANVPVTANLDLGFGYGYERLSDAGLKYREHVVNASLTPYLNVAENLKLFADATLGYVWAKESFAGWTDTDNDGFWSAGVGAELALGARTALTGRAAYGSVFDSSRDAGWSFSVGANHWFTEKVAGVAGVTFVEDDSIIYQIGVAFRF